MASFFFLFFFGSITHVKKLLWWSVVSASKELRVSSRTRVNCDSDGNTGGVFLKTGVDGTDPRELNSGPDGSEAVLLWPVDSTNEIAKLMRLSLSLCDQY